MFIRPIKISDAEQIVDIMRQPNVLPNIVSLPSLRAASFETRLRNATSENHDFVAEDNGKVVGMIGLSQGKGRRAHTGSLFLFVDEDYHGKGIGSLLLQKVIDLADNWLLLERIDLTVIETNLGAKKLYEKYGFKEEGYKAGTIIQNGSLVGEIMMARFLPGGRIETSD